MHDDDFSDAKANIVIKSIAYDENYGRRENTEQKQVYIQIQQYKG